MAVPRSKYARAFYRCADKRRVEAAILFKADQPTGAVYLAGYVADFMLKALNLENTPASQQESLLEDLKRIGHNLTRLLELYDGREAAAHLPRSPARSPSSATGLPRYVTTRKKSIRWTPSSSLKQSTRFTDGRMGGFKNDDRDPR